MRKDGKDGERKIKADTRGERVDRDGQRQQNKKYK